MMMILVTGWLLFNAAVVVFCLYRHVRCERHEARVRGWLEAIYADPSCIRPVDGSLLLVTYDQRTAS